jgi:hypothetical protein
MSKQGSGISILVAALFALWLYDTGRLQAIIGILQGQSHFMPSNQNVNIQGRTFVVPTQIGGAAPAGPAPNLMTPPYTPQTGGAAPAGPTPNLMTPAYTP